MSILLLVAAATLAAAVVSLVRALGARRELSASLERAAGLPDASASVPAPAITLRGRQLPLVERAASVTLALRRGTSRESIGLRLAAAGLSRRVAPDAYLAAQGILVGGGIALGLLVAAANPVRGLLLGLGGSAAAIVLPDWLLSRRAARRRELVLAELPGALDLLAISVQAGLGFDAALVRVTEAIEGPLSEELALMLAELRVGEARQAALQRLAERVDAPEIDAFARAVMRADQLGMPLSHTLRLQAADVRSRRQVAVEEKAAKAPVKILLPTAVFIFPALFVVILGPTLLTLTKVL
jgi:tight adherence protein C